MLVFILVALVGGMVLEYKLKPIEKLLSYI